MAALAVLFNFIQTLFVYHNSVNKLYSVGYDMFCILLLVLYKAIVKGYKTSCKAIKKIVSQQDTKPICYKATTHKIQHTKNAEVKVKSNYKEFIK